MLHRNGHWSRAWPGLATPTLWLAWRGRRQRWSFARRRWRWRQQCRLQDTWQGVGELLWLFLLMLMGLVLLLLIHHCDTNTSSLNRIDYLITGILSRYTIKIFQKLLYWERQPIIAVPVHSGGRWFLPPPPTIFVKDALYPPPLSLHLTWKLIWKKNQGTPRGSWRDPLQPFWLKIKKKYWQIRLKGGCVRVRLG